MGRFRWGFITLRQFEGSDIVEAQSPAQPRRTHHLTSLNPRSALRRTVHFSAFSRFCFCGAPKNGASILPNAK
jgi:hypothetical protein